MNIFLTGAAGYIGGSVATALLDAGHRVRGLVRGPAQADAVRARSITPLLGTLDDTALLAGAARAADAVINAANAGGERADRGARRLGQGVSPYQRLQRGRHPGRRAAGGGGV
jgi:uncharacterized protein YbjT (DUF2867 family)